MKNFLSLKEKKAIISAVIAGMCLGLTQAYAAATSSFFDWRLKNPTDSTSGADELSIVSPVEAQKYGTCWAFATLGSYESSWLKQLKAAKEAGYNVTPQRTVFSKYYLAWTSQMPAADNSDDDSIRASLTTNVDIYNGRHTVYDQGGDALKSTSFMVQNGAVDADSVKMAKTDEERSYALTAMDTAANWKKFNNYARMYIASQEYKDLDISDAEREKLVAERAKTLTDDEIKETSEDAFYASVPNAVLNTVSPKGNLHDTYTIKENTGANGLTEEQIADTKEMIQKEGIVFVGHKSSSDAAYLRDGEVNPHNTQASHAETLVGWDDNYVFKNYTNTDGSPIQGAFIMRNSWGTTVGEAAGLPPGWDDRPMAKDGYGYLSYKDTSIAAISFFNAELDASRYTINQTNAPSVDSIDYFSLNKNFNTQAVANTFSAGTDSGQFLKAVMFYASEKNMPYEIIVREGETPGEGVILTKQSGTFGENGQAKWGGIRTVDLDNFVFLAKDKKYTVEVRTTSPEGKTVNVALMTDQDVEMEGDSYYYDEIFKTWTKTDSMMHIDDDEDSVRNTSLKDASEATETSKLPTGFIEKFLDPSNYKRVYIYTVARNKESSAANGGDFKVSWLDDTDSSGNSVVNLGSASELYGSDYANPDRKTLSNMTVDLNADIYNFYRGSIIGEGKVTKTGKGFLALTGENTYTGGTLVNNGRLDINGSIKGDAVVTDNGVISGSGEIGGALKNNAAAIAGNLAAEGDLTVNSLESTGKLITQGDNKFIVKTTANVDGSTITSTYAKPDEDVTVVEAASVSGNVKNNSSETAEKLSSMLESYAEVTDNKVILKTDIKNNMGELNANENEGFTAVKNMSLALTGDKRKDELMPLLYLDSANAKTALSSMGSSAASDMYAATQRSAAINNAIRERAAETKIDHNGWVKYTKNWGDLKSGANYHSQGIIGGYDEKMGANWRGGVFVGYNATGLGKSNATGNIYDTRVGVYALYHKGVNDAYIYADYGEVKNRLHRGIPVVGVSTEAKYDSSLIEIGGEYKRHLQPNKIWNVSPFINLQYTHLKQDSYNESGGGIFNHHVKVKKNNYLAGLLGVEFKRNFKLGSYAARVGVKHAFTKLDGALDYSYEGDSNNVYTMKNNQSRTHFVLSLAGETEFAKNFILGGHLQLQKGSGNKDISASLMLRKVW